MRYFKVLLLMMCFFSLSLNLAFANGETKFSIGASNEMVDVTKLYVVNGVGAYEHCKALKGYPGEERFQVYFQGDTYPNYITYEDLRGINLDEVIEWELDGKTVRHLRRDIYRMFSDSSQLHSRRPGYTGQFSQEWNSKTFGHVYDEWFEGMAFSQDAQTLINHYFEYKNPNTLNVRDRFPDIKIINK